MKPTTQRYSEKDRETAMEQFRAELQEFAYDALVTLKEDLKAGVVARGSWAGCPISYKYGSPGSCRRAIGGRAKNAFTVLWDNGWLSDDEVMKAIERELAERRPVQKPTPEPAAAA